MVDWSVPLNPSFDWLPAFLPLILFASAADAQTTLRPIDIRNWAQVNLTACGVSGAGTRVQINQIRNPTQSTTGCWPVELRTSAWSIITTRCTRCHGDTGPPADTLLTFQNIRQEVGNLDLRTRSAMLQGGSRGPALVPGDSAHSLMIRFVSWLPSQPPTITDIAFLDANQPLLHMPPYPFSLTPQEISTLQVWIDAGVIP